MSDMWYTMMCEGAREVLVLTGAWVKFVKYVSGVGWRPEEGAEEARQFWGGQGRQWEHWEVSWFAFIPERG